MSVDKFGRYQSRVIKAILLGPPGINFQLTAESDYDMQTKRLRIVAEPMDQTDAVTVEYVNDKCLQEMSMIRIHNFMRLVGLFFESKNLLILQMLLQNLMLTIVYLPYFLMDGIFIINE